MANNMESFDFDALDSAAFQETMSFLNSYSDTLLPDPLSGDSGAFGEPMSDWLAAEDPAVRDVLGNPDSSGGMPDALTDCSHPGYDLDKGSESYSWEQFQVVGLEAAPSSGDLGMNIELPSATGHDLNKSDKVTDGMALPCLVCDWPSCTSNKIYASELELCHHKTDVHIANVLKGWPGLCLWPGCNKKKYFKTSKLLESHVYNIHITPLCCNVEGCNYKKPFERQAELERHVASRHQWEKKYKCRYRQCGEKASYSRKDKLRRHENTCHNGQFPCRFNHCVFGFPSEDAQRRHHEKWSSHNPWNYECEIGSCRLASKSAFGSDLLLQHLEYDHKISPEMAKRARQSSQWQVESRYILTLADLPNGFSDYQDCESCVKKLKEAASSNIVEQH